MHVGIFNVITTYACGGLFACLLPCLRDQSMSLGLYQPAQSVEGLGVEGLGVEELGVGGLGTSFASSIPLEKTYLMYICYTPHLPPALNLNQKPSTPAAQRRHPKPQP
jgi:hypothetical protein